MVSVNRVTCFVGSKWRVNKFAVRIDLSPANSWLCSGSHWNTFFLPSNCLMAVVACEKSGMKNDNCCANPRNDLTPVRFVGAGKGVIAFIRSGSGFTPSSPTKYPANCICFPSSNFFWDRVMISFWQLWAIVSTLILSSGINGAQTSVLSTIFLAQGSPSRTVSDRRHHSSEEALRPFGRYLYLPLGRRNVSSWRIPRLGLFRNSHLPRPSLRRILLKLGWFVRFLTRMRRGGLDVLRTNSVL